MWRPWKWKRFQQWGRALDEELGGLSRRERRAAWWTMARVFLCGCFILRRHWHSKLRACHRCPVYDRSLKRCRPFTGSKVGCGCFCPVIAFFKRECWGDLYAPDDAGWKRFRVRSAKSASPPRV